MREGEACIQGADKEMVVTKIAAPPYKAQPLLHNHSTPIVVQVYTQNTLEIQSATTGC